MKFFFLGTSTLLVREFTRFIRQKNRVIGALATPLLFWFLIGSGLSGSFQINPPDAAASSLSYLQYFFPGTILLILLFTAIFSTISIIEDRNEGFLQGVLVSPTPRLAIVAGKLLGSTSLAVFQGLLFFVITPFIGIRYDLFHFLYLVAIVFLASFGLSGLGFLIAWRLDSVQGFHAIMNIFLMPLWLLSGALFPMGGSPGWLRFVMTVNPVSYAAAGLHHGFFGTFHGGNVYLASPRVCLAVTAAFAVLMFILAWTAALKDRD